MVARVAVGLLGSWLALSAMLWPHLGGEFINAVLVGLALVFFATLGMAHYDRARRANGALGLWLVLSTLVGPTWSPATTWNDVVVGVLVMGLSLVPLPRDERGEPGALGPPLTAGV